MLLPTECPSSSLVFFLKLNERIKFPSLFYKGFLILGVYQFCWGNLPLEGVECYTQRDQSQTVTTSLGKPSPAGTELLLWEVRVSVAAYNEVPNVENIYREMSATFFFCAVLGMGSRALPAKQGPATSLALDGTSCS